MTEPKVCLVTGANSGIGRACAEQLAGRGATVVMLCRNRERGEAARAAMGGDVHLLTADMESQAEIRAAVAEFKERFDRLDVLVNNAARFDLAQKEPRLTDDGYESIWAVNHLGPFLLTNLLLPRLERTRGRVLNVSSKGVLIKPSLRLDFDDIDSRQRFNVSRAYYRSKLAQCSFTIELARREPAITASIVRVTNVALPDDRLPDVSGWLKRIYRFKRRFAITPEQMAETYTWLALDPESAAFTGRHIDYPRMVVGFPAGAREADENRRLWDLSVRQTALSPAPI
ncbi:MAG: SDR family NAD(P)-dependent oxidoreductase [Planctomycetota bacterium]|jgi:NAD(P)-dependent dehydrogenase (short-subunit alcohol dehydrogenase family)